MKQQLAFLFFCIPLSAFLQSYELNEQWQILGPNEKPLEDSRRSANGIGPVEFITANKQVEGLLLAGALNGGLFYSIDGGEAWVNAGSDNWPYSACAWAQFHPQNAKAWFAYSNHHGDNGSAGPIGNQGGIYRTIDSGLNWDLIADKSSFINSEYLTVHGFKFHPVKPDYLYAYTTEGVYLTENCLADEVKWNRITDLGGWVFDMDFNGKKCMMSQMQHTKWNVFYGEIDKMNHLQKIDFIAEINDPIESITCEPYGDHFLILINYLRKGDEVWKYHIESGESEIVLKNQRVIFGKGRTFAISPYRDELIIGSSTTMKRYDLSTKNENRMGGGYHVDIERVLFDPFDSMKVYIGTHGGVYMSEDNGSSWISKSKGLGVAEVEGMAIDLENSERIAIGCYHDGSSLREDFNNNGLYQWKNVNGGDGLIPLLPNGQPNVVYSSNQYSGGGLYISLDSGRTNKNIHSLQGVKTTGWSMAAILHPIDQDLLFFNFEHPSGENKGNGDLARTTDPTERGSAEFISDFKKSHGLKKYVVYGVYNSVHEPNALYIHVIDMTENEAGKSLMIHRVYKTDNCTDTATIVQDSWRELEIPRSDWIGSIIPDQRKGHIVYLAYVSGKKGTEGEKGENGLIYRLKYKKRKNVLRSDKDITSNIPSSPSGRYNLISDEAGGMFFGSRTGVYYGDKKTLKGRGSWQKIGHGLPHCKVHGLYYDKKRRTLTVGFFGRGVWRYYL
ncbi:MAG: hypothetical protein WDZ35_02475 [Crocinitomicaceae bacterium]